MKKLYITGIILFLAFSFQNCQEETVPDHTKNKYIKKGNLLINTDPESLSSRITYHDKLIPVKAIEETPGLKSAKDLPEADPGKNYAFKLKAEVLPPEYEGTRLQATHVTIKNDHAFVTYNVRGAKWLGGYEIIDVSNREKPRYVERVVMPHADVNSVDYYNGKIYLVGATGQYKKLGYDSPAFMEVISLNENMNFAAIDTMMDISSHSGTDIRVGGNKIYATSGSQGGLSIFDSGFNLSEFNNLENARAVEVDVNSKILYVLQGQDGRINVFNQSEGTNTTYNVGGATIPGSKSEIAVSNEYIFAALNDGGLSILNQDGTVKQEIPRPEIPDDGHAKNYVTNSVSLHGDLVLIGNGAAGVHLGGISDSLYMMGKMDFDGSESVNFVEAKDSLIFVATGMGGLKIAEVFIDKGLPEDIVITDPCETLMADISEMFPEMKDVRDMHKDLFSDTAHLNIKVTEETPVYVTFIDEGASWKNTFGYYTYPAEDPPASVEELDKHVVFPNASKTGEGGGLDFGDRVQLGEGSFPKGTVIGFYITAQGWSNGRTTDGLYTHYTNREYNTNQSQQSTLFLSSNCDDIVLTFEDIQTGSNKCDHDFNDIIVTIKDTTDTEVPNTKLEISELPRK